MLQSKDTDLIPSSMKYIYIYIYIYIYTHTHTHAHWTWENKGTQREQIIRKYKKKPIWAPKYSNGNKKTHYKELTTY